MGIQLPKENFGKVKIKGQGLGQGCWGLVWVQAPPQKGNVSQEGADARSLEWARRDTCVGVGTRRHRPHRTGYQAGGRMRTQGQDL